MIPNSPDAIDGVMIKPLTDYESVQAAAVFHELLKREDPYALTRTIEHVLKMRAQDSQIANETAEREAPRAYVPEGGFPRAPDVYPFAPVHSRGALVFRA